MMEAYESEGKQPPTDYIYCDKQRDRRKDDSIREKENRTSSTIYTYIHTWINEERRANYRSIINCIVHLLHLSKYKEKDVLN